MFLNELKIIDPARASIDQVELPALKNQHIALDVLRLDKIHPIISGNKWFKLKGHLQMADQQSASQLITFGGAWSNHIIATAYAAKIAAIPVKGFIRGEKPQFLSDTLQTAAGYGMELEFISREAYALKEDPVYLRELTTLHPQAYIIPEGGAGPAGIKGAGEILRLTDYKQYSHILCAIGTGTMYLGISNVLTPEQKLIGIPVLKGMNNLSAIARDGLPKKEIMENCQINNSWHFGGYARKTDELIDFMNNFYHQTQIPSDFVYTGKLFYAALDMINKELFPANSRLLLIHSGGLQGNLSLSPGILDF
jgi:1-aminocyclopropane-1-carboxylate deaminase/D-cysteine desulfhydrase-like pyridoxal-dependent ACC family enzyme